MPDYSKGKIYKIVDNTNGNIYIGSTTRSLAKRLADHRSEMKQSRDGKRTSSTTSAIILENGNYDIVLIEDCNCETKEQLHRIERNHIELNNCVNVCKPLRTFQEYQQDNKQRLYEYHKQYYKEQYNKKIQCECGCKVGRNGMKEHKKTTKHLELMKNNLETN